MAVGVVRAASAKGAEGLAPKLPAMTRLPTLFGEGEE